MLGTGRDRTFYQNSSNHRNFLQSGLANVRRAPAEDDEFSSNFAEIIDRVIQKKRRDGTKEKTIRKILQITSVFLEITGVDDVTDLRQGHIAKYVDTLAELPKSYRKSPKDREKPISDLPHVAC